MRRFALLVASVLGLAAIAPAGAGARVSGDVAALQVALRAVGTYHGTVDGVRGPATARAVRALQRRRGLTPDGVAGPATRRVLGRRGRPAWGSRTIGPAARGWDVVVLQFLLASRGFPSGPFDGGFGERTRAALRRYQRWAGVAADGLAGRATQRSLRRPPARSPIALRSPVALGMTDRFGPRGARFHSGVDFPVWTGAPVRAAHHGRVAFAGWDSGGYGRLVVVAHPSALSTWYAHLSHLDARRGQAVAAGALLGRSGASGRVTGPHLHFEARLRGAVIDPRPALLRG